MVNEKVVPVDTLKKKTEKHGDYTAEIIRDWYGNVDPFYLPEKNPNFAYRFVRDDTKSGGKNMSIKQSNLLFQKGGWQICPKSHLITLGVKESEFSADGLLRRGDTVLCFMPRKLFEEKDEYRKKRANEPMDAIKRLVNTGDDSVKGLGHPNMKGIQTKKKLNM
jgi:hypothetical protein